MYVPSEKSHTKNIMYFADRGAYARDATCIAIRHWRIVVGSGYLHYTFLIYGTKI